jgi:Insertion element 4 transposase N-terminal
LRAQSAIRSAVVAFTRSITVAAGVFAPGHLGELTRVVPFELVDAMLEESGGRERRLRLLPSWRPATFVDSDHTRITGHRRNPDGDEVPEVRRRL